MFMNIALGKRMLLAETNVLFETILKFHPFDSEDHILWTKFVWK